MIEKILAVGNGVRPHRLIRETFVQNLKDQKAVFKATKLHNKTADMEVALAHGAHGPRALMRVVILEDLGCTFTID